MSENCCYLQCIKQTSTDICSCMSDKQYSTYRTWKTCIILQIHSGLWCHLIHIWSWGHLIHCWLVIPPHHFWIAMSSHSLLVFAITSLIYWWNFVTSGFWCHLVTSDFLCHLIHIVFLLSHNCTLTTQVRVPTLYCSLTRTEINIVRFLILCIYQCTQKDLSLDYTNTTSVLTTLLLPYPQP